jgi:1-acyl-sn-glycerol-3-phosphate acyltransferase
VPRRASLPVRAWRATRTFVHVFAGIATTTFVFPVVKTPARRALVRRWSKKLLRMLRVELRVAGDLDAPGGNVLVVANHISWLDIFVLNAVQPVRFIAKAELARWPVAGALVRGCGTLFVERSRKRDARRVNHHVAEVLEGGDIVAIFPEGTTTDGTEMLEFKSSLLQPIVEAHGHVQPVAIRYRDADGSHTTTPAYVGDDSFMASFWRVCSARSLTVELYAIAPLSAREGNRRVLAREAERAIRSALGLASRAPAPGTRADRAAEPQ